MNENKIIKTYQILHKHYGELNWWPASSPFEVMVGAILTQNTNWSNVEKAIVNFEGNLYPQFIQDVDMHKLIDIIRPSGFFNQKAVYLKAMTKWYKQYDYSVEIVQKNSLSKMREELLAVKGIGFETADSILLYAFEYPTFVVDAYTKRLVKRLGISIKLDYHSIKSHFESAIPPNKHIYNNYHATIVIHAKEHCRKIPKCMGCPLVNECEHYYKVNKQ